MRQALLLACEGGELVFPPAKRALGPFNRKNLSGIVTIAPGNLSLANRPLIVGRFTLNPAIDGKAKGVKGMIFKTWQRLIGLSCQESHQATTSWLVALYSLASHSSAVAL